VKIRAGFYDHTINAVDTAKLAEDCGVGAHRAARPHEKSRVIAVSRIGISCSR
jgi:hypothetical protein